MYCFGIDVGGTSIKCGLFSEDGELKDKWEIPTRTEESGKFILPDIAETIQKKMEDEKIEKAQVKGVGIGLPGPVTENGEILCAVNLYWGRKNVEKELTSLTGLPSKAGNDANVAALGEVWKGAAEGKKDVLMVTLGTGVGGGIILNGRILTGVHGAAGEIGHANVNPDEEDTCNCGNRGCLEQMASATGIVRLARKELASSGDDSILRKIENVTAKDVFDAYKQGDLPASRIVDQFAKYLGMGLSAFVSVLDPEVILIGGGVSKAGQALIDCVEKYYKQLAFPSAKDTPLLLASLGNDAGIYGAARLVIQNT